MRDLGTVIKPQKPEEMGLDDAHSRYSVAPLLEVNFCVTHSFRTTFAVAKGLVQIHSQRKED
jgi:hypothetical protein